MSADLNSSAWMIGAYLMAAALAASVGLREQRVVSVRSTPDLLPVFWLATVALYVTFAIAHAGEFGDALAELGRREARSDGWYDARRSVQTIAVVVVAAFWLLLTMLAIWRFPQRRRRYLLMTVVVTSLVCFSAVRLVSLHRLDTLLYRRDVGGVRIGVVVELCLVAAGALVAAWRLWHTPGVMPEGDRDLVAGPRTRAVGR